MLDKEMLACYAEIGKLMSSESRIQIVTYLINTSRSVEALAKLTGLSVANVSKHLQGLLKAGFVKNRRDGAYIVYEIADDETAMMIEHYLNVANTYYHKRQAMIEAVSEPEHLQAVTLEELDALVETDTVTLIDVRPSEEYEHAHISGAISIPIDTLSTQLKKLPVRKPIVAYCRGAHCLLADEAVTILEKSGRQAVKLNDSVLDWMELQDQRNQGVQL